jgi:hypothetical protein
MTAAPSTRRRQPSIAAEIAAITRAGLYPQVVHKPDGTIILTGLPPEKVQSDQAAEDLDARMDAALGAADGDGD